MPHRQIPGSPASYELVNFDANGVERNDFDGVTSTRVIKRLKDEAITDLFVACHGWQGDIPAAMRQYDNWVTAMTHCTSDVQRTLSQSNFRSLVVGVHWPSLPWGDEEIPSDRVVFSAPSVPTTAEMVELYANRIADTDIAREALRTIFAAANQDPNPAVLPPDVARAFEILNRESGLGSEGVGGAPESDRLPFDPQERYDQSRRDSTAVSFGIGSWTDNLLSPLRQLSFWKMKDRGRAIGETGVNSFLRSIMTVNQNLRIHLMGHSFGCIVVSSAIVGAEKAAPLPRSVQSLLLIQGALSLWSYAATIPDHEGVAGYFRQLVANNCVSGPIVTTRSIYDTAVGTWYPRAAGAARQYRYGAGAEMETLPEFGGVGGFGIQGTGLRRYELEVGSADEDYNLQAGGIYNFECSSVIKAGGGFSGAHSDIAHPEIAHLIWSAAFV